MKVLHICPGNMFGGVETHLRTLARFRGLCPEMEPHVGVCYQGRLSEALRATGASAHMLQPTPTQPYLARYTFGSDSQSSEVGCWIVRGTQAGFEFKNFDEPCGQVRRLGIEERAKFLGQWRDVSRLLAAGDIFCQHKRR